MPAAPLSAATASALQAIRSRVAGTQAACASQSASMLSMRARDSATTAQGVAKHYRGLSPVRPGQGSCSNQTRSPSTRRGCAQGG